MNPKYTLMYWTAEDAAEVCADYTLAEGYTLFDTQDEAEAEGDSLLDAGKARYFEVWVTDTQSGVNWYVDLASSDGA